jgi:hypothetical protein
LLGEGPSPPQPTPAHPRLADGPSPHTLALSPRTQTSPGKRMRAWLGRGPPKNPPRLSPTAGPEHGPHRAGTPRHFAQEQRQSGACGQRQATAASGPQNWREAVGPARAARGGNVRVANAPHPVNDTARPRFPHTPRPMRCPHAPSNATGCTRTAGRSMALCTPPGGGRPGGQGCGQLPTHSPKTLRATLTFLAL